MIDKKYIGYKSEPLEVDVEKGQLQFFAKATGERNPVYWDEAAAKAAGHRALPAPPTFAFTLNLSRRDPFHKYRNIGIDMNRLLHGEQHFEYFAPIYAGDRITLRERISDIYDKKDGQLEFVVYKTEAVNQEGEAVVTMTTTAVIRNG